MFPSSLAEAGGGFVRVPRSYLHLPISPGAKVVLLHLCAAADDKGESWYSYADIAEIVGRSKASVSGYVSELAEAGLVARIRQKMANGFNYRLKLKILGWSDLLAHWAGLRRGRKSPPRQDTGTPPAPTSPGQSAERSVQSDERPDPTGLKTKIQETKTPPEAEVSWSSRDEAEWRDFRSSDRDPPTLGGKLPSPRLEARMRTHLDQISQRFGVMQPKEAKAESLAALKAFCRRKRLSVETQELEDAASTLAGLCQTTPALQGALAALETAWKPHWRRLSTPAQIREACGGSAATCGPSTAVLNEVSLFRQRLWVLDLQKRLRSNRIGSDSPDQERHEHSM